MNLIFNFKCEIEYKIYLMYNLVLIQKCLKLCGFVYKSMRIELKKVSEMT